MDRVLFLARGGAGWGGMERVLNLVASALSARFDVGVLLMEEEKACFYPYPPGVRLLWTGQARGLVKGNVAVRRILRSFGPSIVVLTGVGEIKFLLASLLPRRFKLIVWEHFNAAVFHGHLNRRLAARIADAIVSITVRDAEDWKRLLRPRGPVVAIPNPVPSFPVKLASLEARVILSVGRFDEQKHFDLLIEAFALIAGELEGWKLRLRGSGRDEHLLRALAEARGLGGRVEILPATHDMAAEYEGASLYAMSSRFEGFPMVLLEAMAAGLPCVSVDCPNGPREMIEDGQNGLLTPIEDAQALAEAIKRVALDAEERKRMGARARTRSERFALGPIVGLWERLLFETQG